LLETIRGLPPVMQAVFNLFVVEGYSHKEIGAMMNFAENTSKWYMAQARKRLQIKLLNQ
jgi:RNA polymerase sigma-70 factor (ECF subfamily)